MLLDEEIAATVLHCVNQLASVRVPSGAKKEEREKYGPGRPVFLHERILLSPEGASKSVFSLAREELSLEEHHYENLPQLRAVVQSYRTGFGGIVTGVAQVPATGSVVTYLATGGRGPDGWPVGTVFTFSPVFEAAELDELGPVCPVLDSVEDATLVHLPVAQGPVALHSRAELVKGFYSPDQALQNFLFENFSVNASPYTGGETTFLNYYGGGELFKRVLAKKERARAGALDLPIRDVERLMAKISVYEDCGESKTPDRASLRGCMSAGMVHVAIPTRENFGAFASYLQKQMEAVVGTSRRFRICVGVLVDEFANTACMYNTEHCPFFDPKGYPWAKSFTLLEGNYVISEYSPDASVLLPAVEAMRGSKLLMVEFDSAYQAIGCLPYPQSLSLAGERKEVKGGDDDLAAREVLVGMHEHDPRVLTMLRDCGASLYKSVEDLKILALTFETPERARDFIAKMRDSKSGAFVMTRKNLYANHAFTLVCRRPAMSDELFVLLEAVEVMALGKNRYRFTSPFSLLTHAKVLYKHNRWKKNESVKKFRSLRDDANRYVFLDRKLPASLSMYQRRPPLGAVPVVRSRRHALGLHWYRLTNLPRDVPDAELREALVEWGGLGEVQEWRIDRANYNPIMWMGVSQRVIVPRVLLMVFSIGRTSVCR